jgi:serine/threonine protein kinase
MTSNKVKINNVKNRFLPIPESVTKGLEPEPKISDFQILKELGAGSFGHVYLVSHKITKAQYAIKAIDKRDKSNQNEKPYFRREIEVMYKIHHPNVVKLFGHFEDNNYCYFIMEYIEKGNIYNLIPHDGKKKLNTKIVASLIKDVISAVYYLHHMKPIIIHRDIKPENVLLGEGLVSKLTDFGWSNYMQEDEKRKTVCGTPIYLAPEIIKEEGHDEKVDIWCIGVLLFELITGNVPFQGNDLESLKENILHLRIAWPKDINTDAKNLIKKILKLDPGSRISLEEMLQHPFISKHFPNAINSLIKPGDQGEYPTFIINKDDPNKWEPVIKSKENSKDDDNKELEKEKEIVNKKQKSRGNTPPEKEISTKESSKDEEDQLMREQYEKLYEKYEILKRDFEILKDSSGSSNDIEEIKKQIKEKEERIVYLTKLAKDNGIDPDEISLQTKFGILEKQNIELKQKVSNYEQIIREKQGAVVDNKLKEFRDSISGKDKDVYSKQIENMKKNLDKETRQKLNEIIKEKEKQIKLFKNEEKTRREKEKKRFITLINKYDKTLTWVEKENKELKKKIAELEKNSK